MALLTKRGDSDRQHSAHKANTESILLNKDTPLKNKVSLSDSKHLCHEHTLIQQVINVLMKRNTMQVWA